MFYPYEYSPVYASVSLIKVLLKMIHQCSSNSCHPDTLVLEEIRVTLLYMPPFFPRVLTCFLIVLFLNLETNQWSKHFLMVIS